MCGEGVGVQAVWFVRVCDSCVCGVLCVCVCVEGRVCVCVCRCSTYILLNIVYYIKVGRLSCMIGTLC